MSKLIITSKKSYLKEESDSVLLKKLDDALSFKVQGAEHTRAFKGYFQNGNFIKWDGFHRILQRDLSFPTGLSNRVIDFYKKRNAQLEIIDERPGKSTINSLDILPALEKLGLEPRPYQWDVLDVVKDNDMGIIRAATGAGKTLVAAMQTAYFGKRAIIYVIGKDLLHQLHQFFSKIFDIPIGIIGDGQCDIQDINIASVWTVGQALGLEKSKILIDNENSEKKIDREKYISILDLMRSAKVHIFDECHLAACDTIQEISKNINPEHIYGMSASPWRDDGADMLIEGIFGSTIVDISASQLIREGYLVKPFIKFVKVPKLEEKLDKKYQTIYKNYIIENDARNQKIITATNSLVEQGYRPLVLYSKLNHGKKLFEEISKNVPVTLLSGKDSQDIRQEAKNDLESGKIKCIVASTIFDIGVDLPALSGLIIAGGGKSSVRALQRIGRVIRLYEGKTHAAVIDFVDQATFLKQHSVIRYKIYSYEEDFDITWPK